MNEFLNDEFLGNPVQSWLVAAAIAAGTWLALLMVRRVATRWVGRLVKLTGVIWDDVLAALIPKTHGLFLLGLAVLLGARWLELQQTSRGFVRDVVIILGLLQLGRWATCVVTLFVDEQRERRRSEDPASVTTIGVLGFLARVLIWVVVAMLVLANAGVEIGPLVAGMGVGGIAVALAVQTVLKDLLASLSIMLDKPFIIGDFLIIDDMMGSVEHIGIKTTRIRSLSGEQLVFANNDLLESRIRNFGRMRERRAVFHLGVTYDTPPAKLERIPAIVREAVEQHETARFDRCHFKEFSASSLDFETVYYVAVPDMNAYLDIQQAINLRVLREFSGEGIEFAYPTQTVIVAGRGAD